MFVCLIKCDLCSFKDTKNVVKQGTLGDSYRGAVAETGDEADLPARKTARAANKPRLRERPANHRALCVAGRRHGTKERIKPIKQTKRKKRKQGGGENRKNTSHQNTRLTAFVSYVLAGFIVLFVTAALNFHVLITLLSRSKLQT